MGVMARKFGRINMRLRNKGEVHGGAFTLFLAIMALLFGVLTIMFYVRGSEVDVVIMMTFLTLVFAVPVFFILWSQRWNYYKEYP